jgi:hypothetical protein
MQFQSHRASRLPVPAQARTVALTADGMATSLLSLIGFLFLTMASAWAVLATRGLLMDEAGRCLSHDDRGILTILVRYSCLFLAIGLSGTFGALLQLAQLEDPDGGGFRVTSFSRRASVCGMHCWLGASSKWETTKVVAACVLVMCLMWWA